MNGCRVSGRGCVLPLGCVGLWCEVSAVSRDPSLMSSLTWAGYWLAVTSLSQGQTKVNYTHKSPTKRWENVDYIKKWQHWTRSGLMFHLKINDVHMQTVVQSRVIKSHHTHYQWRKYTLEITGTVKHVIENIWLFSSTQRCVRIWSITFCHPHTGNKSHRKSLTLY